MHVLLVYCHPREESFCATLRDAAVSALNTAGHTVEIRDLYAEAFAPALTAEQRGRYYQEGDNTEGLDDHIAALRRAEGLVLVYPTWWFGMPAMLKGWFDRVWVPGVAFRLEGPGKLRPMFGHIRRIGVVTTYGSPGWLLWRIGWPDWRVVRHGFRPLCAPGCRLDWIALSRMDSWTQARGQAFVRRVGSRLARWR